MSKRQKRNAEKRAAIKTNKKLDANKTNCPHCGVAFGSEALEMHIQLAH